MTQQTGNMDTATEHTSASVMLMYPQGTACVRVHAHIRAERECKSINVSDSGEDVRAWTRFDSNRGLHKNT